MCTKRSSLYFRSGSLRGEVGDSNKNVKELIGSLRGYDVKSPIKYDVIYSGRYHTATTFFSAPQNSHPEQFP